MSGWTKWIRPIRKGYKMECCDCGLVHTMDFAILGGKERKYIAFRVQRDEKTTARKRKKRNISVTRRYEEASDDRG